MFIDLTVAFAYLWSLFGPYMGLLMVATVISYLYITTKLYSLRASKRRDYITIYRKEWTIGQQSLDGWGTASVCNLYPIPDASSNLTLVVQHDPLRATSIRLW
jgi:ABC-type transport system involved in Fe-S cluster assembly fused permease/ATPase subunit